MFLSWFLKAIPTLAPSLLPRHPSFSAQQLMRNAVWRKVQDDLATVEDAPSGRLLKAQAGFPSWSFRATLSQRRAQLNPEEQTEAGHMRPCL